MSYQHKKLTRRVRHIARRYGKIILAILLVLLIILLAHQKIANTDIRYAFYPKNELRQIYADFLQADTSFDNYFGYDQKRAAEVEPFYKNIIKSDIYGTRRYEEPSEFLIGFDRFLPDFNTPVIKGLSDYGRIVYDSDVQQSLYLYPLDFDILVLQYKDVDFSRKELSIQGVHTASEFVLGYMTAIYLSPTGKVKTQRYPLSHEEGLLNTREGIYFLKEVCIFTACNKVGSGTKRNDISYHVLRNGEELYQYTMLPVE